MSADRALLEVEKLSRHFFGLRAVHEVSFSVMRGELVGLIGPNGAGKTTVFNCIAGALPPTAGELRFDGSRITGSAPASVAALGIARTFQNLRVFPDVTVYDNVSVGAIGRAGASFVGALFPALDRGRARRIAASTRSALERMGLAAYAVAPAGNLSYGQKKMLEIARAIALEPKLLLLDEPAAGLNAAETESLAALVRGLREEGITVLLVEHDMPMVMGLCDRVLVLDSGQLIANGAPTDIRANPAVRAAYLGDDA